MHPQVTGSPGQEHVAHFHRLVAVPELRTSLVQQMVDGRVIIIVNPLFPCVFLLFGFGHGRFG